MTDRQADIQALLERSERDLTTIAEQYNASLKDRVVAPELKVEIKSFCGNLRSVLDYLAHDIRESCCPNAPSGDRFYFPILPDRLTFEVKVAQWYPGLKKSSRTLWGYLESVQPYQANWTWLGAFNRLNNENKHDKLVPQTSTTTQEVRVTSTAGAKVSWNPANVTFGGNVKIAGVPVDPITQMPVPDPSQEVEVITWVGFQFAGINVSALWLLRSAYEGVKTLSHEIRRLL